MHVVVIFDRLEEGADLLFVLLADRRKLLGHIAEFDRHDRPAIGSPSPIRALKASAGEIIRCSLRPRQKAAQRRTNYLPRLGELLHRAANGACAMMKTLRHIAIAIPTLLKPARRGGAATARAIEAVTLAVLFSFLALGSTKAVPPVVSNVQATQRAGGTTIVDVTYDLTDAEGDAQNVQLKFSANGGLTWGDAGSATGHVGSNVIPGLGKVITWNASGNLSVQSTADVMVRVVAFDQPPAWTLPPTY